MQLYCPFVFSAFELDSRVRTLVFVVVSAAADAMAINYSLFDFKVIVAVAICLCQSFNQKGNSNSGLYVGVLYRLQYKKCVRIYYLEFNNFPHHIASTELH